LQQAQRFAGDSFLPKIFSGKDDPSGLLPSNEQATTPVQGGPNGTREKRPAAGTAASGTPRIPPEVDGLQVNFCKDPACWNFGVPPKEVSKRGPGSGSHDTYVLTGSVRKRGTPAVSLRCKLCGDLPPVKSNLAIAEEVRRLTEYLTPEPEPSCPDETCPNHAQGIHTSRKSYQRYGKTIHGSPRYRCKSCGSTFAVPTPTTGQKKPHENREIFMELVNKAPFRRILEKRDISAATLYQKIDFLFQQCKRFLARREGRLAAGMVLDHLSISVDRQDYYTNWISRENMRNVPLHAVISADNRSGYVFGAHLNFDPRFSPTAVEADVMTDSDHLRQQEYRRNARFWLISDYKSSVAASAARRTYYGRKPLDHAAAVYKTAEGREDIEVSDEFSDGFRLPESGMQVHSEYTLYAHFQVLNRLLKGAKSVTFYLDQDSGIRAACLAAFKEEVKAGRAHAFYVTVNKGLTKGKKLAALSEARKRFAAAMQRMPGLDERSVKLQLIKDQFPRMRQMGRFGDRWLEHPLPTMNEPEKALCHLSGRPEVELSEDRLASMYLYGSMYGADRFMELIRRRLSILERGLTSASSTGQVWSGYAPYKPYIAEKLLLLLRVYWNYCFVSKESKDGKTPAERLGLAKGHVRVEDIVYFDPHADG